MAESNKRKIADPIDLNDEDPFAELTRIMGFDPRLTARSQPANQPGPAAEVQTPHPAAAPAVAKSVAIEPEPAPAVEAIAHDDFGIDLEKELMGEFADFEPAPPSAPAPAVEADQPDDAVDMAIDDDFEDAFNASLEQDVAPAAAPVVAEPAPVAVSQTAHPHAESYDDDAAFDDVMADEIEAEFDRAPELDHGSELDLGPELDLDDLDLSEPHVDEAPAEPELPAEPVAPARAAAPAVAVADALAEVDMDFSSAFDEALRADDADDHGVAQSPALEPRPAYHAAEPMVASADPLDLSLEEELNAMLDGVHAEPEPEVSSPAVTVAPEPAPRAAPASHDSRRSALDADDEVDAAESVAAPVAAAYRRPFIDPAIVGRLASFKAAPAPAPKADPAPKPEEDLDDLLDAMESEVHPDHATAELQDDHEYAASPAVEHTETAYAYDDAAPAKQGYHGYEEESPADHDPAPDVETIDVPEMAVAVADDLDIPELAYEQDEPTSPAYDDLDADYHRAYAEPAAVEEPITQPSKNAAEDVDFDNDFQPLYRPGTASDANAYGAPSTQGYAAAAVASADYGYNAGASEFDEDEHDTAASDLSAGRDRFVDLDFDSDVEEEIALPAAAALPTREAPQRRGLLIAAVVGGVALLGGVGALALSFGNGDGADVPVVVKADGGPVKVKPENPGGTSVPNQENKVYDAVKGSDGAGAAPAQERLVTTSEEPVDMAAVDETTDALPGVTVEDIIVSKAEDRVDPAASTDDATAESIAVAPRRVKTMVVRADGTLAPREDPAPSAPIEAAPTETAATEAAPTEVAPAETEMVAKAAPLPPVAEPAAPEGNDETGAVTTDQPAEPTFQSPGGDPVPVKTIKTDTITATESTASVPDTGPAVESRPAEQPVDVVGEVKPEPVAPEQVAAANVEPAAIATGAWSVQIASQPSAESAKSTYEDLARRYGGVIGGRGVNIVKADIAGKGTYWRVRVPAQSRNDAIKLCTNYKSAGGNCFVSK